MNILIISICLITCFLVVYQFFSERHLKKEARRQKVLKFKLTIYAIYGVDAYKTLPSVEEMLKDKRPLTVAAWLDI